MAALIVQAVEFNFPADILFMAEHVNTDGETRLAVIGIGRFKNERV